MKLGILSLLLAACGAGAIVGRGVTYGGALDACIVAANSRAEADACRQKVDCQYGEPTCVAARDAGGAVDAAAAVDAGASVKDGGIQ
jgi:hypothetical protein